MTASMGRIAGSGTRRTLRHAAAFTGAVGVVLVLETLAPELEHGTHLLVVLLVVLGVALLVGPWPAATALAAGGGVAAVASVLSVDRSQAVDASVQLFTYGLAGVASVALASVAPRGRERAPASPSSASGLAVVHDLAEPLTLRESEVLRLAATGISVEEIARRLFVSPNTIKTHLTHIYAKLGVRGRADAVRAAIHCGCLTTTDICPHLAERAAREGDHRFR